MSIVSFDCLLMVLIVIVLYFCFPPKKQWIVVLLANIVFYCYSGVGYFLYILIAALVSWFMALKIDSVTSMGAKLVSACDSKELVGEVRNSITSIKKLLCGIAIVVAMGIWVVLKYSNFFIDNVNRVLGLVKSGTVVPNVSWVIPIGISFYTFHVVGYVVDIYRKKYVVERNFFKYLTFVSYFPHIIQGPFSRYDELGVSIFEEHKFSYDRLSKGAARILWGAFKKLIIADTLAVSVTEILANYSQYTGTHIPFAFFAYAIQLYADFSGYMDMVCGFSSILGINLAENFKQPYFAKTVDEYWRRWHITLGKWFKDYLFMPISMGPFAQKLGKNARKKWGAKMGKLVPGYFALIFVWGATGLWHGASWKYLIWGYLNLIVIVSTMQLESFYEDVKKKLHINSESFIWKLFCIIRTFCLVCFFRFFSIGKDVQSTIGMLKHMFTNFSLSAVRHPSTLFVNLSVTDIYLLYVSMAVLFIVDLLNEKEKWERVKEKCPFFIKDIIYVLLIVAIMLFAGGDNDLVGGFMYAKF